MTGDYYEIPYGCMECASIIPELHGDTCPRCGSLNVMRIDEVLNKLIESEIFMESIGIESFTDND